MCISGGFIAQKFTESTANCPRVASLVLCNTFTDTAVFEYNDSSALFWLLPSLVLKRMLMGNFTTDKMDKRMAESIDFMVERVRVVKITYLILMSSPYAENGRFCFRFLVQASSGIFNL